ncbi:MAG: ATP synthase subunit delta [candidate division TM6 bacterium GW2011_GWF2_38_10]|nr:MAG: ATP synthase subunit delta [candidate division TM6 bacterium GW2011_GWF2_38_10]
MLESYESLTAKYAIAFFKLYKKDLTRDIIKQLQTCYAFLSHNKHIKAFLMLSTVMREEKIALFKTMFAHLGLPNIFLHLVKVLIEHRRIELVGSILKKIDEAFGRAENIMPFVVSSSHNLSLAEQNEMSDFVRRHIAQAQIVAWDVNRSLICGVRVKSATHMWERSVRKQLRCVKLEALQRVQL